MRTGAGKLKLITWQVSLDGQFLRLGDSGEQAGEVSLIELSSVGEKSLPDRRPDGERHAQAHHLEYFG